MGLSFGSGCQLIMEFDCSYANFLSHFRIYTGTFISKDQDKREKTFKKYLLKKCKMVEKYELSSHHIKIISVIFNVEISKKNLRYNGNPMYRKNL